MKTWILFFGIIIPLFGDLIEVSPVEFPWSSSVEEWECPDDIIGMHHLNLRTVILSASHSRDVRSLNLNDNYLDNIKSTDIHLTDVECLNLARNSIPPGRLLTYKWFYGLTELNLNGQRVSSSCTDLRNASEDPHCNTLGPQNNHFPELLRLNIGSCNLKYLPKNLFQIFPILRWLNVSNNKLHWDEDDIVKILPKRLNQLLLSNVNANKLKVNNLNELEHLVLDHNEFHQLGGSRSIKYLILDKLKNLRNLSLRNCSIEIIHNGAFNGTPNLIELDLTNNQITQLDRVAINIPTLIRLSLARNNLGMFPLVNELNHLETLSLSYNKFTFLPMSLERLESLRTLLFKENRLKIVGNDTLSKLKQLRVLNLAGNGIEKFHSNWMDSLNRLEYFDVSYNNVTKLEDIYVNRNLSLKTLVVDRLINIDDVDSFKGIRVVQL